MSTRDGGKAFPGEKDIRFGQPNDCNEGMTLRDHFAAKVLVALVGQPDAMTVAMEHANLNKQDMSVSVAGIAYKYADAMLAAREVNP